MSDPTLLVLSSLAEGDKHGYKIMQDVEAFAYVTLGPGTLYGAITRLEERGWIEPVGPKDRRQTYTITPAGRAHLQGELAALQQVVTTGLARFENCVMRRLARFAVTLYPAGWRERYGEELRALVEDSRPGWASVFDLLRGAMRMRARGLAFAKLAAVLAVGGAVAGLGISFLVTPKYASTAVGEVRLSGLEANGAGARPRLIEFLEQMKSEMTSRQALAALIQNPVLNLYDTERKSLPLEDVEDIMRNDLKVFIAPMNQQKTAAAPVVFSVRFAYPDRTKAQAVVDAWVSRMIDVNLLKAITGVSAGDRALLERIARLQERIDSLERHFGMVSTETVDLAQPALVGRDIVIAILNPANLPDKPIFPNRAMFMATGCGTGFTLALLATIYRRRFTTGAPQHTS